MEQTYYKHPTSTQNKFPENNQSEKNTYNSSQGVELELGVVMILFGLLGLFRPEFLGLALNIVHCLILVSTGVLAVWSGLTMERRRVFYVAMGLGIFYLLNALLGYFIGEEGPSQFGFLSDEKIKRVAPGFLELSHYDHLMHLIFSVGFFIVAFHSKRKNLKVNEVKSKFKVRLTIIGTIMSLIFFVILISYYITKNN
jgi:hypothetical protein